MTNKENSYRSTIMKLLTELKNAKEGKNMDHLDLESEDSIYKVGLQDNSSFQSENTNFKNNNSIHQPPSPVKEKVMLRNIKSPNYDNTPVSKRSETGRINIVEDDSFLNELIDFKNEDKDNLLYRTDIPMRYQTDKLKLLREEVKNDGKITRYYENNVITVQTKNGNLTKVFKFANFY